MSFSRFCCFRLPGAVLIALLVAGCSMTPYRYQPLDNFGIEQRAQAQESGAFKVLASVPSDEEAEALFGIPLSQRGIQAVWLKITNSSDLRARFAPYSVDDRYFPPHEVAYMYRKQFSSQGWLDMEKRLFEMSIPRYLGAGQTVSGFVFTNAQTGTKSFNVDIFLAGNKSDYTHFTFFINVPGFKPDHAEVNFKALYGPDELQDVNTEEFRTLIDKMPCCTTNSDGTGSGQPIDTIVVSSGIELLQALLRAGWSETSYLRSDSYLNATDYFLSRPPDVIFRKGRDKTTERNEMGLWLTPIRVDDVPVWVTQIKHAIGRRYKIEEQFLGVKLDPDINDGRNFLLQNLWYSEALSQYAWSASGRRVDESTPELDFNNNAWFSDGYRLIIWVSGEPVSHGEVNRLDWGPVAVSDGEFQ